LEFNAVLHPFSRKAPAELKGRCGALMMNQPTLIWRIRLGEKHVPTGGTHHYHGSEELPPPVELRIVKYDDTGGYYLFYCDNDGNEITDTYHDTIASAMKQAHWEFNVAENEWEK
jgi:hypothetical protein